MFKEHKQRSGPQPRAKPERRPPEAATNFAAKRYGKQLNNIFVEDYFVRQKRTKAVFKEHKQRSGPQPRAKPERRPPEAATNFEAARYGKQLNNIFVEDYRSGHNEAVLKTVWVQAHGGSNPSSSAKAE